MHHRRRGVRPPRRGLHGAHLRRETLHSGVIEIFVKKDARVRYCTTHQNWSTNVPQPGDSAPWSTRATPPMDGNMGAAITMSTACFLMGEHARGGPASIGFAG